MVPAASSSLRLVITSWGNSSLDIHEGEEVMEISVDGHDRNSNFSPVLNCSSIYVIVSSPEQLGDSGDREIMFVDGFVLE